MQDVRAADSDKQGSLPDRIRLLSPIHHHHPHLERAGREVEQKRNYQAICHWLVPSCVHAISCSILKLHK